MNRRPGLSIVESVVSLGIIAGLMVAALNAVSAARVRQTAETRRDVAILLAQDLMTEILVQAYDDPEAGAGFGVDSGESGTGRKAYDDLDDYDYAADDLPTSPPQYPDGSPMLWASAYGRRVDIAYVNPSSLGTTRQTDGGIKRITVTIYRDGVEVLRLVSFRTQAAEVTS